MTILNATDTLLVTSSGQEWQFPIANDIYWSMANDNFELLVTSSGQEWQISLLVNSDI